MIRGLFILLFALLACPSWAEVPVPPLTARVTDLTGTLTLSQRDGIEQSLKAFEEKKGSQIAVLIVPTTKPEEIEQYGIRVAETWKLGRKGVDDGILFLVSKNDRKMRIEVGRGLEGAVPDAVAKRIIAEIVTPRFKQGDFEGGIREGVERLVKVIEGEPLPSPRRISAPTGPRSRSGLPAPGPGWLFWAVFLIPVLLVGASIARALLGRFAGSLAAGGLGGVIVGLIAGSFLLGFLAGVVAGLFALASRGGAAFPGGGRSSGTGWSGGSSCGGGGSDFGGGGGDFGGGGASGEW
ncbi:MAG: hypothetical protein A2V83_05760 [Nitrospirae bacterium RBG_16_64_22]|nr:MAG: hypothetical protein A2V83_05760 [Nitrospirae bacterium RBG_16_64_22]